MISQGGERVVIAIINARSMPRLKLGRGPKVSAYIGTPIRGASNIAEPWSPQQAATAKP
jgi:hypothetical protein